MHTKLARAALIVVLLGTTSLLGEELRVNTLWRMGSYTKNVGAANLIVRDVVGDSRNDIVSCANGYAFALSFDGTTYNDTWHSPFAACNAVAVGDRDPPDRTAPFGQMIGDADGLEHAHRARRNRARAAVERRVAARARVGGIDEDRGKPARIERRGQRQPNQATAENDDVRPVHAAPLTRSSQGRHDFA